MARKPRKIGVGDRVTLQVTCTSDVAEGKWTFVLNGQAITVPLNLDAIKKVVPYDPSSIYDRVR